MKFVMAVLSAVLAARVLSVPVKRAVDPALVPEFGFTAGRNPTGTGDCDGAVNKADGTPIKIPCACPPDRQLFLNSLNKNVAAGRAVNNPSVRVSFPTDDSKVSQLARLNAAIVTLQNLNGPGKGCPVVSTTFQAQQKAIEAGGAAPAAAPPVPFKPPATSLPGGTDLSALDQLTPQFGVQPGQNPTGTGDCTGIKGIKIPCKCPPDRQTFLESLAANIAGGKATNNPSIKVSFPTDNSPASQRSRIQASIVTLQNLNGPGKGCPAASTTFSAQLAAIQA